MMDQLAFGIADKEAGTARALNAKLLWAEEAEQWVDHQEPGYRFTADDLIAACGTPTEVAINANNAVGALFLKLNNQKLIHAVDRVASRRRSNHGRFITVWERLNYSTR